MHDRRLPRPGAPLRAGLAVAGLFLALCGTARANDILVVFNATFPLDTRTRADAKRMFLEGGSAPGDMRIVPSVYVDSDPTQAHFVRSVLGMEPATYNLNWSRKIVREQVLPPKRFASAEALLRFVAETPGAIGYVRQDQRAAVAVYGDRLKVLPWSLIPETIDTTPELRPR